jgi:hypothetical protein
VSVGGEENWKNHDAVEENMGVRSRMNLLAEVEAGGEVRALMSHPDFGPGLQEYHAEFHQSQCRLSGLDQPCLPLAQVVSR